MRDLQADALDSTKNGLELYRTAVDQMSVSEYKTFCNRSVTEMIPIQLLYWIEHIF